MTTVRASELLAASPLASAMLSQLSSLGLVGIGLIPTEPRQILSTRPLIAPSAFNGIRLRITDNPETAALVRAIGARPVQRESASQVARHAAVRITSPAWRRRPNTYWPTPTTPTPPT